MSVIVAKSNSRCATGSSTVCDFYPVVSVQKTMAASSSASIDSIAVAIARTAKWIVTVTNADRSRMRTFEVHATHRAGTNPTFVTYGFEGSVFAITPTVTLVGSNLVLSITNSELVGLVVYATRKIVPVDDQPQAATSYLPISQNTVVIRALQQGLIDFIPDTDLGMMAVKLAITLTSDTTSVSSQVLVQLSSTPRGVEYAVVGSRSLNHDIVLIEVANQGLEILLTNQSSEDIAVDVTRVPVHSTSANNCAPSQSDMKIWHPQIVYIGAGVTRTVDTVNGRYVSGGKWLLGAIDVQDNRTMACEVGYNTLQGVADHSVYGTIADKLNLAFTTTVVAGRLTLEVKNNDANTVHISLLRVPTTS
jgi:hypothetical protein